MGLANLSVKRRLVSIFSFTSWIPSVAITQLCRGHTIAATDNTHMDEQGHLSRKLYLRTTELKSHIVFIYRETFSFDIFPDV